MSVLDYFVFISIIVIWGILAVNLVLTVAGYTQYLKDVRTPAPILPDQAPFVSVMVPAHNEGIVIVRTVLSLLNFDYPHDRYEIIVINDNSSDNSAQLLAHIQETYPERNLTVINTDKTNGGQGQVQRLKHRAEDGQGQHHLGLRCGQHAGTPGVAHPGRRVAAGGPVRGRHWQVPDA